MPLSGNRGAFGWVGQVAQDDFPSGVGWNTDGMTFHKVLQGDFSLQDDQRPHDPEVGGSLLSPGTYKSSYWSQGRLSLRPRLGLITGRTKAHSLVPILWSLAGSAAYFDTSTTVVTTATIPAGVMGTDTKIEQITGAAGDDAIFFPGASGTIQFGADLGDNATANKKWLALRKLTPTATGYIGETFYNCRVAGLSMGSSATGPIGMDIAFQGGAGNSDTYDQYVLEAITGEPTTNTGWNYETALNVDTIPHAGSGWIKLGASSSSEIRYVRDLQVTIGGNMTKPQDMTMIGQYAPGDYALLSRDIGITYTFLWDNADLYRAIKLGGTNGTEWSSVPSRSPVWCRFADMGDNYSIGFFGQDMDLMTAPIGLRGQTQVVMQVSGVVRDVATAKWALWITGADLTNMKDWPI